MTRTIAILIGGFGLLLAGSGLLGTLLGVRATLMSFGSLEIGLVMAGYYAGYIAGTRLAPQVIRDVGHIRTFAALAAVAAAVTLAYGLLLAPLPWLLLRFLNGLAISALYTVVESWLNEQSTGPARGRVFSIYMTSTLLGLGAGQLLLPMADPEGLSLFALAAILISVGLVPIAVTRVTEPEIRPSVKVQLSRLFRVSPLGVTGVFGAGLISGVFWGMTPVFAQTLDLHETQIAILMSATILGGGLLQWPIGHLSDSFDRRVVLIMVSFATALGCLAWAYIVIKGVPGLVVSSAVFGGLMFSLYGISVAHTNDHISHDEVLEATRGLLLVFGVGALLGPLLAGVAMELAGPPGLPAVSAVSAILLAGFGIYRTTRRAAPEPAEQGDYLPMVRTTPVALEMHPETEEEQLGEPNPDRNS